MRKPYNILILLLLSAVLFAGLAACRPASVDQVTEEDVQGLRDYVLSSYYMLKGDANLSGGISAGRATVPVHTDPQASFSGGTKRDYPELGQLTTWTVEDRGSGIYKITVLTEYANNGAIDYTEEVYYVKDEADVNAVTGTWGTEDPVVQPDGSRNDIYRDKFITVFKDGSIRYEELEMTNFYAAHIGADNPAQYAAFGPPADAEIPASEAAAVTTDATANFSSKVNYQQEVFKQFAFWNVLNKVVVGTRYYTEHGDPAAPVRTSISYERTIERENKGLGGLMQLLKAALYDPSTLDIENATLAQTVIWYKIDTDGTKEIVQKTKVVNDFGDDFYITGSGGEAVISAAP